MPSPLNFIVLLALILSIFVVSATSPVCPTEGNNLNCTLTTGTWNISTNEFNTNVLSETRINYDGNVLLSLIAPRSNVVVIEASGSSACLQIQRIETAASLIEIRIALSSAQLSTPVFSPSSTFNISNATVVITIKYSTVSNMANFRVFGSLSTASKIIKNYQIIFGNSSNMNSGSVTFENFLDGLNQVSSVTISGNNQTLRTNGSPSTNLNLQDLILRKLYLSNRILESFNNVSTLTIEQCSYNRDAQFLQASRGFELSLTMKNNNPLDLTLPNASEAFRTSTVQYNSITLIEPRLNSSWLKAIGGAQRPRTVTVEFGNYQLRDFEQYAVEGPTVWHLTVRNLRNLNVIPSKFFSKLDGLQTTTLEGSFKLAKQDICSFVGFPIQGVPNTPIVQLQMSQENQDDSDACARTYTSAITVRSESQVQCPGKATNEDCRKWAKETRECRLVDYENACSGTVPPATQGSRQRFYFNGSAVQRFLDSRSWDPTTTYSTNSKDDEKLDFRPIIGAVVGLLAAITILTVTIFCIRRLRRKEATKYVPSAPTEKGIPPSSYDTAHLSIATSKTSKSSTRALEKSFFPVQPTDEIAPPLYTAPSEAVGSVSRYQPSAPPGRRDSVSTHATHVYETLDS